MKNLKKQIYLWNYERGLHKSFSVFNEYKMLQEELLEFLGFSKEDVKEKLEGIIKYLDINPNDSRLNLLDLEGKFDSNGDFDFVNIGTGFKMIFNRIVEASIDEAVDISNCNLQIIIDNNNKKGSKKDDTGKIIKDENHEPPKLITTFGEYLVYKFNSELSKYDLKLTDINYDVNKKFLYVEIEDQKFEIKKAQGSYHIYDEKGVVPFYSAVSIESITKYISNFVSKQINIYKYYENNISLLIEEIDSDIENLDICKLYDDLDVYFTVMGSVFSVDINYTNGEPKSLSIKKNDKLVALFKDNMLLEIGDGKYLIKKFVDLNKHLFML